MGRGAGRAWRAAAGWRAGLGRILLICLVLPLALALWLVAPGPVGAAPGLCVGPVCGDEFSRSALYHWQLRLRVSDQRGHRERLVVDCRSVAVSPDQGLVERGFAAAVARRACRLAGEGEERRSTATRESASTAAR